MLSSWNNRAALRPSFPGARGRQQRVVGDAEERLGEPLVGPFENVAEQGFLVRVVVVERGLGQAAGAGQHFHGGAVVAVATEGAGAALEKLVAGDFQRTHGRFLLSIKGVDSMP